MKKLFAVILSMLFVLTIVVSCSDDNKPLSQLDTPSDESVTQQEEIKVLTPEEVLINVADASEEVNGFGMLGQMELSMSTMGETIDMVSDINCEMNENVVYIGMNMSMIGLEEVTSVDTYIDLKSDPMVQYSGVDGMWIKQNADKSVAEQYSKGNMQMDLSMYSEYMKNPTMTEVEFDGVDCYELSGVIDIDFMKLIENMNLESVIGDLEAMGLSENFYEEVFRDMEPFTLVMGVNKDTHLPVYASMDMTQMMDKLMSKMMEILAEQYGEEAIGDVDINISKCNMNCVYRDYNNISIEIPVDVIENALEY